MKKAILLINLGSPSSPDADSVKSYLKQFLSDPYVIHLPNLIWQPILNGIILKTRPQKSAKLYQQIWGENGSPLITNTEQQAKLLQAETDDQVHWAMTYGMPAITDTLRTIEKNGIEEVTILPLFPQFSYTTTGSVLDIIKSYQQKNTGIKKVNIIHDFHQQPKYIQLLQQKIQDQIVKNTYDTILFSYHGLPVSHIKKGDPYQQQCEQTTQLIMKAFPKMAYQHTYQSKFGPNKWLTPSTSATLQQLPQRDKSRVLLVTPGFTADCLETLHEINIENKELFSKAGGQTLDIIPPFNQDLDFIHFLKFITA